MKYNKKGYPKIESEEQYWEEYNKWKAKLDSWGLKDLGKDPQGFLKILQEGADREVIPQEYVDKQVQRVHREAQMPEKFKEDVGKARKYIKDKAKSIFKKNGKNREKR